MNYRLRLQTLYPSVKWALYTPLLGARLLGGSLVSKLSNSILLCGSYAHELIILYSNQPGHIYQFPALPHYPARDSVKQSTRHYNKCYLVDHEVTRKRNIKSFMASTVRQPPHPSIYPTGQT